MKTNLTENEDFFNQDLDELFLLKPVAERVKHVCDVHPNHSTDENVSTMETYLFDVTLHKVT